MPKYDIILLDADETVYDFRRAEDTALSETLRSYGIDPTEDVIAAYSAGNLNCWKALERGELTRAELKPRRFRILFDALSLPHVDFGKLNSLYELNLSHCGYLLPGAEDFLRRLRSVPGVRSYIATNGSVIPQTGRYRCSGIYKYVDGIYISESIGVDKPSPAYFDYIFRHLGVDDRSRCIILGDSLTSDMLGGRNAGIATCHYLGGRQPSRSTLCDYEISSYDEFFDIIQ